jgi:hypothetical protein
MLLHLQWASPNNAYQILWTADGRRFERQRLSGNWDAEWRGVSAGIGLSTTQDVDCDTLTLGGLYRATGGTRPNSSNWHTLHINRLGNAQSAQIMVEDTLNVGGLAWRNRIGDGTWTPYKTAFHRGNIVGTVSQSAGVPTGAIIQRGSNANGQFTRYADGTAEYWGTRTVTGVTINPASNGNANTSFAPADPLTLDLTDKVFSVVRANGFAADGTEVYMIRAEPTQQFLNLGTRPADQFPYLNQIGTRVITSYSYAFRAVGRWFNI